ncbi:hypothetical protein MKK88_14930 [Methylobacterium sp. E-005]|uniref:hypothetical protein n=1 Tax=Methylobacterium sp. E-005 TaxID=2836549 RepID=UPI001FBAF043|nr:hypothetical protein [Methylobacterium sp. E-005]MCJ2087269.1 hypothetical protein [Methylobacterium sp. E-005]
MARRTQYITLSDVDDDNRDKGKTFLLTELSAEEAEDWGLRALLALSSAGAEVPDDFEDAGMAGLAAMGVDALRGLKYEVVRPLWRQMFQCVQICPNAQNQNVVRGLVPDDIEEISTRLLLRKEIVELHVNFSRLASLSKSALGSAKAPPGAGGPTPTGPDPWALS